MIRLLRRLGFPALRSPPQDRFHPRFEIVGIKRLGDEIVGAQPEPQDRVALAGGGATDNDGQIVLGLQISAQHEAIYVRQYEVQDYQVWSNFLDFRLGSPA